MSRPSAVASTNNLDMPWARRFLTHASIRPGMIASRLVSYKLLVSTNMIYGEDSSQRAKQVMAEDTD